MDCCDCNCEPLECCGEAVGFSILGVGLVVVVVGALIFLGFRSLNNNDNKTPQPRIEQRSYSLPR
jgi:hypothetical protein